MLASQCSNKCLHAAHPSSISTYTTDPTQLCHRTPHSSAIVPHTALPSYPTQLCHRTPHSSAIVPHTALPSSRQPEDKLVVPLDLFNIFSSYTYSTKMFPSPCFKCQYINYSVVTLAILEKSCWCEVYH